MFSSFDPSGVERDISPAEYESADTEAASRSGTTVRRRRLARRHPTPPRPSAAVTLERPKSFRMSTSNSHEWEEVPVRTVVSMASDHNPLRAVDMEADDSFNHIDPGTGFRNGVGSDPAPVLGTTTEDDECADTDSLLDSSGGFFDQEDEVTIGTDTTGRSSAETNRIPIGSEPREEDPAPSVDDGKCESAVSQAIPVPPAAEYSSESVGATAVPMLEQELEVDRNNNALRDSVNSSSPNKGEVPVAIATASRNKAAAEMERGDGTLAALERATFCGDRGRRKVIPPYLRCQMTGADVGKDNTIGTHKCIDESQSTSPPQEVPRLHVSDTLRTSDALLASLRPLSDIHHDPLRFPTARTVGAAESKRRSIESTRDAEREDVENRIETISASLAHHRRNCLELERQRRKQAEELERQRQAERPLVPPASPLIRCETLLSPRSPRMGTGTRLLVRLGSAAAGFPASPVAPMTAPSTPAAGLRQPAASFRSSAVPPVRAGVAEVVRGWECVLGGAAGGGIPVAPSVNQSQQLAKERMALLMRQRQARVQGAS